LEAVWHLAKPPTFLFASTAAVYAPTVEICNATDPVEPVDIYGLTKYLGEQFVAAYAKRLSLPAWILRLFNGYGSGETNPHVIPEILHQIMLGKSKLRLGNLSSMRDYIWCKDIAEGMVKLIQVQNNNAEVINLGSRREYSVLDIIEITQNIVGRELTAQSLAGRRRHTDRMHLRAGMEKSRRLLQWNPNIDLEQGLRLLLSNALSIMTDKTKLSVKLVRWRSSLNPCIIRRP